MTQLIAGIANIQLPGRGLGHHGELLYHFKQDLKNFKELTKNHVVIMGRKTFDSLPDKLPLKNRINIIITSDPGRVPVGDQVIAANTPEEALRLAQELFPHKEIWIIGGGEVFTVLLPNIELLCLTKVPGKKLADAHFPDYHHEFTSTDEQFYTDEATQKAFSVEILKRTAF